MNAADARRIIMQNMLFNLTRDIEWGDYDEIGEEDWRSILGMIDDIAVEPSGEDYTAAYTLLRARSAS